MSTMGISTISMVMLNGTRISNRTHETQRRQPPCLMDLFMVDIFEVGGLTNLHKMRMFNGKPASLQPTNEQQYQQWNLQGFNTWKNSYSYITNQHLSQLSMVLEYSPKQKPQKWPSFLGQYSSTMENLGMERSTIFNGFVYGRYLEVIWFMNQLLTVPPC